MDFYITYNNQDLEDKIYIGKKGISDDNSNQIVYDWRSPVGQRYYLKNEIKFKYNEYYYKLLLRRALEIKNKQLIRYNDEYVEGEALYDGLTDPFLLEVIKEKRTDNVLTDIIKTIQSNQNKIITNDLEKNMVIQGCAGSGKTMILLHRLSYLLFNNKHINKESVKIITPNNIFNKHIDHLARELELDKIERLTVESYYISKLCSAGVNPNIATSPVKSESTIDNSYVNYIYSEDFLIRAKKYIKDWFDNLIYNARAAGLYKVAVTVKYF